MPEPWQHFYQSQRLKLAYWTWGEASNPPLILLHGGRDHARSWDRVAEALRDDFHVIACDLRGHGDSDWARGTSYGLTEHIPDLVALIDLVGGHANVMGHSFGGQITLLTAGAFPERFDRVVTIEGAGARMYDAPPDPMTPEKMREWVQHARAFEQSTPRVYPTIEDARDRMQDANKFLSPEMAMHLARYGTNGIDGGYVWKFDPWARGRTPAELLPAEVIDFYAKVTAPVLHIVGTHSDRKRDKVESRPLDEFFSDSRTVVVEDAGHWVHHDQLDELIVAARPFLLGQG